MRTSSRSRADRTGLVSGSNRRVPIGFMERCTLLLRFPRRTGGSSDERHAGSQACSRAPDLE